MNVRRRKCARARASAHTTRAARHSHGAWLAPGTCVCMRATFFCVHLRAYGVLCACFEINPPGFRTCTIYNKRHGSSTYLGASGSSDPILPRAFHRLDAGRPRVRVRRAEPCTAGVPHCDVFELVHQIAFLTSCVRAGNRRAFIEKSPRSGTHGSAAWSSGTDAGGGSTKRRVCCMERDGEA